MTIPDKLGTPEFEASKAFIPFPAAAELGRISIDQISPLTPQEAAQAVANGFVPPKGGAVLFPEVGVGAVDFQAYRSLGRGAIEVLPNPKSVVDPASKRTLDAGAFFTFLPDGRLKLSALKVQHVAGWLPRENRCAVGGIADPALRRLGLDAPEFEIHDIDKSGIVIARPRRFQVAF